MIYANNDELMAACQEWQKILRLQDWIINASIERARDMHSTDVNGECSWQISKKMAKIKILDPIDYPPGLMEGQDMEITLVHELLHCHYAGFDNFESNTLENSMLEQSIEAISMALVKLKREAKQ